MTSLHGSKRKFLNTNTSAHEDAFIDIVIKTKSLPYYNTKTEPRKATKHKIKKEKVHFLPSSCRVCLNNGDIHIFDDESLGDLSEAIFMFTGVKVCAEDNLPKFLCNSCNEQLQSAILFKQTAQQTNKLLKAASSNDITLVKCKVTKHNNKKKCLFQDPLEETNVNFQCKKCDIEFKNSNDYGNHMITEEHRDVCDACPFCHREFKCIVRHLTLHKRHRTVLCDICGKKFLKPIYMNHRESHFDNLPLKCPECPYQGRFSGDLKIHLRKHSGERPYKCSECPQSFTSKSNLNRHMLRHNNDYPLSCEVCGKGYLSQRQLNDHLAGHSGVKSFSCTECDKAFSNKKGLMKHTLRVHKREKLRSGRIPNYLRVQNENEDKVEYLIICDE